MARFGCLCDNTMSNSDCPSVNIIEVYEPVNKSL